MNNLSNTLLVIFITYIIFSLIFMAIDGGVKRFLETYAFERSTCIRVTNVLSFVLSGILLSFYLLCAFWVLFTQIDNKSNMNEVWLVFGIMFWLFFISVIKFSILPNRRNYGKRN